MSLLRVRLSFCQIPVEPKNCWFLIDTSVCRVVADLEYCIRERFDLRSLKHGGAIDLVLDEFLLPSQEKIEVIRDNDIIRVQESWLSTDRNLLTSVLQETPRAAKRKENSPEVQPSKRQHLEASTDNEERRSGRNNPTQVESRKKSVYKRKKERSKKISAKSGPRNNESRLPDRIGSKHELNGTRHNRQHKHHTKDFSKHCAEPKDTVTKTKGNFRKVSSNSEDSSSGTSSMSVSSVECQLESVSAKDGQASVAHGNGGNGKSLKTVAASTPTGLTNGSPGPVVFQPERNPKTTPTNAHNASVGRKYNVHGNQNLSRNQNGKQQAQVSPRIANRQAASVNRSTHVRFDSDEGESDQQSPETNNQEAAASELSPRAWYPLGTDRALAHTSAPTASLGAKIQTTQHRGAVQPCVTQQQGAVEDGRAPTLLSPGQQQQENSQSQTAEKVRRDYSQFVPLHGPPRTGDRIAYKILELSASYTPEISDYKEGNVLDYDSKSGTVHLELTIESLKKAQGDGNVSQKFELIYEEETEETEGKVEIPVPEEERKVAVLWSAMREPLLLNSDDGASVC